jgi:hypothetical protein
MNFCSDNYSMKNLLRWIGIILLATFAVILLLRQTSPDPKFNNASFEEGPLEAEMLPISDGWTLAQRLNSKGEVRTLLVVDFDNEAITGADLHNLGAVQSQNPFAVLASLNDAQLEAASNNQLGHEICDSNIKVSKS